MRHRVPPALSGKRKVAERTTTERGRRAVEANVPKSAEITGLRKAWGQGDSVATDRQTSLVYDELLARTEDNAPYFFNSAGQLTSSVTGGTRSERTLTRIRPSGLTS